MEFNSGFKGLMYECYEPLMLLTFMSRRVSLVKSSPLQIRALQQKYYEVNYHRRTRELSRLAFCNFSSNRHETSIKCLRVQRAGVSKSEHGFVEILNYILASSLRHTF